MLGKLCNSTTIEAVTIDDFFQHISLARGDKYTRANLR